MPESSTSVKPKPSSFLHGFAFAWVRIAFLALLAWLFLEIWFESKAFLQGVDKILLQTQQLLQSEQAILPNHLLLQMNFFHEVNFTKNQLDVWMMNLKIGETKYYSLLTLFERVTEIILIRAFIIGWNLPFYFLMSLIAFTDGLVQRAIRKYRGARESTFKFHRAKHVLGWITWMPYLFILSWPVEFPMSSVLCLHACLIAMVLWYMVMHFKKYI